MLINKFEEQVIKTPANIAVKSGSISLNYDELNRYANRTARLILEAWPKNAVNKRVKNVGLLLDHGPDMIIGILATLKAGKMYVPISVDYPEKRISYMLKDSETSLILTTSSYNERAKELAVENNIDFFEIDKTGGSIPGHNLSREAEADKAAYIMYTSGSTGSPRGVVQTHENVLYYTRNWGRIFSITEADRLTLFSSFCHDGSLQDMFGALLHGATLYPFDMRNRGNSFELSRFLLDEEITIWHSVPSLFSFFCSTLNGGDEFTHLRFILLGGEEVREHEVDMFNRFFPRSILANVYGQTESSVNSIRLISKGDSLTKSTIGDPLDETEVFIINKEGNEVDFLQIGEILVSCPYVSPGYWKNEEATLKTFTDDDELGRLYFTGDRGRLLLGSSIEFLGREDTQVKIRGFRVEPGEIESQLLKHASIKEAVVVARIGGNEDKYLCAYFTNLPDLTVGKRDFLPGSSALREFLSRTLPDYMIPAYFVELEQMPLTQSGKIDRRALPEPEFETAAVYVKPEDEIEKKILDIWAEVLKVEKEKIGTADNFFELGGHSLKALQLVDKIHKEFEMDLKLKEVFNYPTIHGLARRLKCSQGVEYIEIASREKKEYYELSYGQRRLWVLHRFVEESTAYNMSRNVTISGECHALAFKKTIQALLDRHESLRIGFRIVENEPVQFISEDIESPIRQVDLSSYSIEEKSEKRNRVYEKIVNTAFDLSKPPLFRVGLVKFSESHFEWIFCLHHIITDGWSMDILERNFSRLYQAYSKGEEVNPEPLRVQYKDFAAWHNLQVGNREGKRESFLFWKERITGGFTPVEFPVDVPGYEYDRAGAGYRCLLDKDVKIRLKKIAIQNNTTLFVVMFSVYILMLFHFSKQENISCSIIGAGRGHLSLHDVIGFFVNSILFKINVDEQEHFSEYMSRVHTEVMACFQHQSYPLETVCSELKIKLPDLPVSFNMLNIRTADILHELDSFKPHHVEDVQDVKFVIELYVKEYDNGIDLNWRYKKKNFEPKTLEYIIGEYLNMVEFFSINREKSYTDFCGRNQKRFFRRKKGELN